MTDVTGAPRKKSGRGCLIVLCVLGGVFFLALVGFAVAAYMAASSPKGQQALRVVQEMQAAQKAPGTTEMKAIGCTQAMVIDMDTVGKDMLELFDSGADKQEKLPAKLSVYCQPGPFDTAPTCADVAHAFVKAAPPNRSFLVTVKRQSDAKQLCSSLYSQTGEFVTDATTKPKSK